MIDQDGCIGGVILPLAQGIITGIILALISWGVILEAGLDYDWIILTIAAVSGGWVYWSGVLAWRRNAYGEPERPEQQLVYQQVEPRTIRVQIAEGSRISLVELPVSEDQLIQFARGVVEGQPLSETQWTGRGRLFLKPDFVALRDELIRRGWLGWVSPGTPARGCAPTAAGRRVFQHIAAYPTGGDKSQES